MHLRNLFNFKSKQVRIILIVILVVFVVAVILVPVDLIQAQGDGSAKVDNPESWTLNAVKIVSSPFVILISWVLYIPIYFFGFFVSKVLIALLLWVANYNNFLSQPGVTDGWQVVRDLANIFVVLGILIIAFGTLFKIENYSYKKLLPKLVLAAILINFSKFIIGILIDFSQVIMLTFVNAFSGIAAGNLIYAIGLDKILTLSPMAIGDVADISLSLIGALILGIIVLAVTTAILLVITIYLVARIIILWMVIVLSPLLFVLPLIPAGQKFSSQIWQMVSKYLITGPILAFFLWLSFFILQESTGGIAEQFNDEAIAGARGDFTAFFSQLGTIDTILNFILVIGLLMASLMMASQMGVAGSKMAGNFVGKMQEMGTGLAKWTASRPWAMTKYADRKLAATTGFAPITSTKKFIEGMKERSEWTRQKDGLEAQSRAGDRLRGEKGGVRSVLFGIGAGRDAADLVAAGGFLNRRGFGNIKDRVMGGNYGKIDKQIDNEREEVAFLRLKKEKGDPLKAYRDKHKRNTEDNQENKNNKQAELDRLPKLAEDKLKEYEKEQKELPDSIQAKRLKSEYRELVDKTNPERKKKLEEEISQHDLEIKKSDDAVNLDKHSEEDMRKTAIKEYQDEAKQKTEDAKNLRDGKLTRGEEISRSNELKSLEEKLGAMGDKLTKENSKGDDRDRIIVNQLKEDQRKASAKIDELKQAFSKDGDGHTIKDGEGNYKIRGDFNISDEIKDEEKLKASMESMGKEAERLDKDAKNYNTFADEAEANWASGEEAINEKEVDDLVEKKLDGIRALEGKQAKYQAPQTFYADQARRSLVAEEEKKITSDNWEEQLAAMQDALKEKNRYKFEANFKAAAKRGNENEIMEQLGYLNAYRGEEDEKKPWEGGGIEAFRKHYLVNQLGMSEQDSMGAMDDVGYIGEGVGHWSIARGYGIKGGRRYAKTWDRQQDEVYAEQSKLDGRKLFRQFNRLGWGGEIPQKDGSQRQFQLEPYTIKRFLTSYKDMRDHISKAEFNKSYAEKIAESDIAQAQLAAAANMLSGDMKKEFEEIVDMLNKYGSTKKQAPKLNVSTRNIKNGIDFV